ncbi:hypothetical protein NJT12_20920 [Flavobacterium sp. AC]|uniref:LysM domain-containing protein n=1 Tax=Flavobacterium azizsancarii TaxID=2961580 RepID=A0ABT4WHN0_9FLAO|nr:hypothetical protein [Flavobacterium azizsancarii]MDA6072093.1 hypothetical protein [Flavobacterium azizsancarii]
MKTETALVLQSWFDLSNQYTGSVTNAYEIAYANGRSITDEITPGEKIIIPANISIDNKALIFLQGKKIVPATGARKADLDILNPVLGIGTMEIESTFIVR